jgi:hypothetical protein
MKINKVIAGGLIAAMTMGAVVPVQAAKSEPGGVKGFIAGCCFGTRAAADYNTKGIGDRDFAAWFLVGCCLGQRTQIDYAEGKDFHWREWCRLIPYAGIVFEIWDGVDGANGVTRANLAEKYGSIYY